jgi:hypothetical protein
MEKKGKKKTNFFAREIVLRIERQMGEFLLIIGSLLSFKGIEPYLDTLQLMNVWWIIFGFAAVGIAVTRLVSYEKKLRITD